MITNAKLIGVDYDADKYHEQDRPLGDHKRVMGRSELSTFAKCPAKWRKGIPEKESDATEWGSLMDCLVMSPARFDAKFAVKPETYKDAKTGEVKKWNGNATVCKEWQAEQEGKILVSHDDFQESKKAMAQLEVDPAIAEYIKCSAKQVYCTAEWKDPVTGLIIPLKILIDLVPDKTHPKFGKSKGDFKSGRDASLDAWEKQVGMYHYHWQSAMYSDVYNAATGEAREDFRHIVQENVPPYQTAKRIIEGDAVKVGREQYQQALTAYCQCLKTNTWPDYDTDKPGIGGWSFVGIKPWAL